MSFKKFSSAQNAPGNNDAAGKPEEKAPADQPAAQPDQSPAKAEPASK